MITSLAIAVNGFFKTSRQLKFRTPMTRLPAKVLIVHRLGDQYLITVQVSEKHRCTLDKLNFGENKPHIVSSRNRWLDLAYNQNPNLKTGQLFPLWTIQ